MSDQTAMEKTPASHESFGRVLTSAGQSLIYITLIVGYLLTILRTSHLTPVLFLVFTLLQLGYCALVWWLLKNPQGWQLALALVLLALLTQVVGALPLLGLEWDWLLILVTLSLVFMFLSLRVAIVAGILLYLALVVNLGLLNAWHWPQTYASLISFLPAFAFVAVFSIVVRFLEVEKDRAQHLLHRLAESNAELEQAHRQLQEYASEVEELTIVRERTRLAREIHDSLGHYLSILTIQLETVGKLLDRDPARAASEVAEARRVAGQSMQEVRNAVAALRPTSIATLSLPESIMQLGAEFERHAPETTVTLDLETELPPLSPDISVALYRAAQEAFTNIRKHAQASKVLVRLRCEDGIVELLMLDNGPGTSTPDCEKHGGFGLLGLRERIDLLAGHVSSGPAEQGGYRLVVRVPLPAAPQTPSPLKQASIAGEKEQRIVL